MGGIKGIFKCLQMVLALRNNKYIICENAPDQLAGGTWNDAGGNVVCDCPADLDGDGAVGGADLTIILSDWGCIGNDCVGDLDGNGEVNGADLTIILSAWGDCED